MSRIIAGLAGSIRLAPAPSGTRPSSDRLKESLFSQLENFGVLEGAKVLDLFAGTGALGLESLSRGARSLTSVESSGQAVKVLRENHSRFLGAIKNQGVSVELRHLKMDVMHFLRSPQSKFNVIFADPPYSFREEEIVHLCSRIIPKLEIDGIVVVEHASATRLTPPKGLELLTSREFGQSTYEIFRLSQNVLKRKSRTANSSQG